MDWLATRPRFSKPAKAGTTLDAPPALTCKQLARRTAMLSEAAAIVGKLPKEGESLHGIMTGRYDLMHILLHILAEGGTCQHLRIATLSFNERNKVELLRIIDAGIAARLSLICSIYFRAHQKELYQATREEFAKRTGTRIASPETHCKVICFDFPHQQLVLEGSANLRTCGSWEQFTIFHDRSLHDFHAAWIDSLLEKHEATP